MTQLTDWRQHHGDAFAGKRALVTGGCGFIGSHLTHALLDLGAQVVVIDDLSNGKRENALGRSDHREPEIVVGSILNEVALADAAAHCDVVFHLAALGSVPASIERPVAYHEVDATGTVRVLEAAKDAGVARVVYSASSSAYGDAEELPKHEAMPARPISPYAAAKLAGEGYVRAWARCYAMDAVSLRYFNIFGPRQAADSSYAAVIAAFARQLLAGDRPVVFGDGEQSRDFTFVDNAVHANLLAARRDEPLEGEVINVATARRVTVNELAAAMARLLDRGDLEPDYRPPRTGDILHSLADLTRARKLLGYEPIVAFEPGLDATLAWYSHVY